MKTVVFYDGVCPKSYNIDSLHQGGLGGTEATVLRISNALSQNNNVESRQRGFNLTEPMDAPDVIVTLRDAGHFVANRQKHPRAKHYLWLHDLVAGDYENHLRQHLEKIDNFNIICVSKFHSNNFIDRLRPLLLEKKGNNQVVILYNPLAPYCVKDISVPVDKNKLVFFSSPHKGLEGVLKLFEMIRRLDPAMTLYIANPGYLADHKELPEGVVNLGMLPHKEIIEHVRSALCVFYPNMIFPETFGLVYAEANAVGTPVLAHPIGAAREILEHPKQLLDCRNYKEVVDRILDWKNGSRPVVRVNPDFKIENIIKGWNKLI